MQEIPSWSSCGDSWNFSITCLHKQLDATWALRPPSITSVVLVVSHLVLALGTEIYNTYLPYLQPRLRIHNLYMDVVHVSTVIMTNDSGAPITHYSPPTSHTVIMIFGYYLCLLNPKRVHHQHIFPQNECHPSVPII